MFFGDIRREWEIRQTLRKLARQRIAVILQPGNVWVIEKAVPDTEESDAALKTCYMRGWVEPLHDAVPSNRLTPEGTIPEGLLFPRTDTLYRVTDSGWAIINRSHQVAMLGVLMAFIGIITAVGLALLI